MVLVNEEPERRITSTNHYHELDKPFHRNDNHPSVLQFLSNPLHHLNGGRIITMDTERICLKPDLCPIDGNHLSLQGHLQRPFGNNLMIMDHGPLLSSRD